MSHCPSCQANISRISEPCPHCGWQCNTSLPENSLTIVSAAQRPKNQCEVILGTTVDRTGSTKAFSVGVPKTFAGILDRVEPKVLKMTCWAQTHGDRDEGQCEELITDGSTPEQAQKDVEQVIYGGGGPPEENHLDAIETLVHRVPWPAEPSRARGIVLAFLTADTKPTQSGKTAREIGKEIRRRDLLLYLVCQPTETLRELADAASGLIFEISNDPDPKTLDLICQHKLC